MRSTTLEKASYLHADIFGDLVNVAEDLRCKSLLEGGSDGLADLFGIWEHGRNELTVPQQLVEFAGRVGEDGDGYARIERNDGTTGDGGHVGTLGIDGCRTGPSGGGKGQDGSSGSELHVDL